MNNRLKPLTRWLSVGCALGLAAVLLLPLWRIELNAPQYPEGLVLRIHPNRIGGDVDVVNGLNHYIGMRTLHTKDFVEFTILPWIIGTLAIFGFLSALVNRKWFFTAWVAFFVVFGIIAMADFYRWEYNYGHNLDDTAPIKVPGMAYQPPLIGYKKLLNFGAYSVPDAGGWIFILVGLLLVTCLYLELRNTLKVTRGLEIRTSVLLPVAPLLLLTSCSNGPEPVRYGEDACTSCRMTISDNRFACEIVTAKGKVYKFDDFHCLAAFLASGQVEPAGIGEVYLTDFSRPGKLLPRNGMQLLHSSSLRSPMGGNIAAFAVADSLQRSRKDLPGEVITWENAITK